jgi:hypothetical protein
MLVALGYQLTALLIGKLGITDRRATRRWSSGCQYAE